MNALNGKPRAELRRASIVINNYNYERFLAEAIESALAQTYPATEVIVVDDGSTDGSRDVIASYGDRVRTVFKDNGGQGSAINAGFAASTGDVIIFLDADDALRPHAIERVLGAWQDGTAMMQYRMDIVDADGRLKGPHPPLHQPLASGDVKQQLLRTGSFSTTVTSGLAFGRRALEQVLPMPEAPFRLAADGYLVRAAAMVGPLQALDERLARYRRHDSNDSALTSTSTDPASFFRKKILYVLNEHETVRSLAKERGLSAPERLGESDLDFLSYRLFSVALDPGGHPLPGDDCFRLLKRYVSLRWNQPGPVVPRIADAATAVGVAVLPRPAKSTLVRWRQAPGARPWWLRQVAASVQGARALLSAAR